MKKREPLQPQYSGDLSADFWARIRELPDKQRWQAYSLGVVLQNVEGDVLRIVTNLENEAKRRRTVRRRRSTQKTVER